MTAPLFALSTYRAAMALLDIPINGLTALFVAAPLVFRPFRPRMALLAVGVGILLDVDHAVAARSLSLAAMLSLPVRPFTHCLGFALLIALLAGLLARRFSAGWIALIALVSHLLRDTALGGVRLFYPAEGVQRIPYAAYLSGLLILLALSLFVRGWLAAAAQPLSGSRG